MEWLKENIRVELSRVADAEFEKAKEEAIKALDRKKGEVIAGIVLYLEQRMSIHTGGREMIITVEKK